MSQKIVVQDGIIEYSAAPTLAGVYQPILAQVHGQLNVGDQTTAGGTILTDAGQALTLTSGAGANIIITPGAGGTLMLNGTVWPTIGNPVPGMFLGASAVNTLGFVPFYVGTTSDTATSSIINAAYPNAQVGQFVSAPNYIWQKAGLSDWRQINALASPPVLLSGSTMTGSLILNADPTTALGAATKQYVDNIAIGLSIHGSCDAATTAALPACVYNNGASGVGATLTASSNGALGTVGGFTPIVGSRLLIKNQGGTSSNLQNGIYNVTSLGSVSTPWILTRAPDFDGSPTTEITNGDLTYIENGTVGGTQWVENLTGTGSGGSIVVGTNPIGFTQFAGTGTYTAGTGISISGTNVVSNSGVTSLAAGTNISLSATSGAITVNVSGSVSSATNIAGGAAGSIPYQTGAGITSLLPIGAVNTVLVGGTTPPVWTNTPTLTGTNITGIPNAGLSNSSLTIGATTIALGGTSTTLSGITSLVANSGAATTAATFTTSGVGSSGTVSFTDTGASGVNLRLVGNGATTPAKIIRVRNGVLEFINSAYSAVFATFSDAGSLTLTGGIGAAGQSYIGPSTAYASFTSSLVINYPGIGTQYGITLKPTTSTANTNAITFLPSTASAAGPNTSVGAIQHLSSDSGLNLVGTWTLNGNSIITSTGGTISTSGSISSLVISDVGTNGANIKLAGSGGVTPNKTIRAQGGNLEIVNSAYSLVVATVSDAGAVTATSFNGMFIRTVGTSISAAGTTLATATPLTKGINVVSLVAAGQGVSLPAEIAGLSVIVMNTSATPLNVYPSGALVIINGGAAGSPFILPASTRLEFICVTSTQWYTMHATYS